MLFSGGIDSTLALAWAQERGGAVHTLEIEWPGRPRGEARAARRILDRFRVRSRHVVRLPHDLRPRGAHDGYLASRNLVYHAVAQSLAEVLGAREVVAGHVDEDGRDFPDARPAFFRALAHLAAAGRPGGRRVPIRNPLSPSVARRLIGGLPVPLEWTWSCWRDRARPCGRCEKCTRRRALLKAVERRSSSTAKTPKGSRTRRG